MSVPPDSRFLMTDLVLQNPNGDLGTAQLLRNGDVLYTWDLRRDEQRQRVPAACQPAAVRTVRQHRALGRCEAAGKPSGTGCEIAVLMGGTLVPRSRRKADRPSPSRSPGRPASSVSRLPSNSIDPSATTPPGLEATSTRGPMRIRAGIVTLTRKVPSLVVGIVTNGVPPSSKPSDTTELAGKPEPPTQNGSPGRAVGSAVRRSGRSAANPPSTAVVYGRPPSPSSAIAISSALR